MRRDKRIKKTRRIQYLGWIIDEVTVNGMTMYKFGSELFAGLDQAKYAVQRAENRYNDRQFYGYECLTDPYEDFDRDGYLRGIKL